jgi:hypothetical protein
MMKSLPDAEMQARGDWFPPVKALWSLFWRLWLLLPFFLGALFCVLIEQWWGVLGCIVGFVIVARLIRRFSTVEQHVSSRTGGVLL